MITRNLAAREAGGSPQEGSQNRSPSHNCSGGAVSLHPAWQALIRFCRDLGHGEIERIKIQDGVPVSAEVVTKKIRWC
jgi:hypothetical protein